MPNSTADYDNWVSKQAKAYAHTEKFAAEVIYKCQWVRTLIEELLLVVPNIPN